MEPEDAQAKRRRLEMMQSWPELAAAYDAPSLVPPQANRSLSLTLFDENDDDDDEEDADYELEDEEEGDEEDEDDEEEEDDDEEEECDEEEAQHEEDDNDGMLQLEQLNQQLVNLVPMLPAEDVLQDENCGPAEARPPEMLNIEPQPAGCQASNDDASADAQKRYAFLAYFCEWEDCEANAFEDLTLFLCHLREHLRQVQRELTEDQEPSFACLWTDCSEVFERQQQDEFFLHLTYHGYHSKLMSIGVLELRQLSERVGRPMQCYMDASSRTLLPGLPESFVCGWKDCLTSYGDAESFYRHVERHPFEDVHIPAMAKEELKRCRFAVCSWSDCNASFSSRSRLRDHLRSHTQEKTIACPHCGSMFFNRPKFRDHLFRQIYNEEEQAKLETLLLHVSLPDDDRVTLTLISQVAQKQPTEAPATAELTTGEGSDEPEPAANESGEAGPIQPVATSSGAASKSPQMKPLQCSYCEKQFMTTTLMAEHLRTHKAHWTCNLCGYKTNAYSSLTHHIIYRHSELRPYACQFCEAKFKSRSDLRQHIDIHSDEHPYKCSLCDFKCRCCHTLAKHRKREHESNEPIYQCHLCQKNFTRGNNLSRHLSRTHDLKAPDGRTRFIYKRSDDDGIFRLTSD